MTSTANSCGWPIGASTALLWSPPPFDDRIVGQSGAFLMGQIPEDKVKRSKSSLPYFSNSWNFTNPGRVHRGRPATILTFRISADAKTDILRLLDRRYGISARTLFPDADGFRRFGLDRAGEAPGDLAGSGGYAVEKRYLFDEWHYSHQSLLSGLENSITQLGLTHKIQRVIRLDDGFGILTKSEASLADRAALDNLPNVVHVRAPQHPRSAPRP